MTWRDSSTHHHDHPLFFHDFSFLNPSSSSAPHPANKHAHVHTLKAGRHLFPFSLHVPGSLPATLRTYSGTCAIEYKLKAIASRPGFGADWRTKKIVKINRGFGVDAVEYNQTLEIGEFGSVGELGERGADLSLSAENTWPGKVSFPTSGGVEWPADLNPTGHVRLHDPSQSLCRGRDDSRLGQILAVGQGSPHRLPRYHRQGAHVSSC